MNPVQAPEVGSGHLPSDVTRRILVLRHAEEEGREQPSRLSSTGRMRAFALPYLLREVSRRDGWPLAPDVLIAAHDTTKSERPSQTLRYLAQSLSLPVLQCWTPAEVLGQLLLGQPHPKWRHAVVVWRHDTIIDVARALGAPPEDLPKDWPDDLYDRVIVLDLDGENRVVRTRCVYVDTELDLTIPPETEGNGCHERPAVPA